MKTETIKVQLLCPSTGCKKCRNLRNRLEKLFLEMNIQADYEIITEVEQLLNYKTWILPTVLINGQIAARGYLPLKSKIKKILN